MQCFLKSLSDFKKHCKISHKEKAALNNHPHATPLPLPPVLACSYDHLGIILWNQAALAKCFDQQREWLERYPEYKIGWDFETYTYDYLAEHAPALLARMRQALQQYPGRLDAAACTYGQPLSMFIDGESNIRQLTYGLRAAEEHLGVSPAFYIMSEHPFHAQLPQLLVGTGFRGAVLRTHFMMYGFCPEYDEPVGWWIGLDGSRIPALPTYRGQASTEPLSIHRITGPTSTLDNRILTDSISPDFSLTLRDFQNAFGGKIQPLVATRADDPRSHESLIIAHQGDPAVRWATLAEAFAELPAPRAEFRSAPNEFKVRMPWGYAGGWIWARSRQAEVAVETAERLDAIHQALGGSSQEAALEQAWKNLLVGQHHDIQIVGMEPEARQFLGASIEMSQGVIAAAMAEIAPRIGRGKRLVAFNPLGWDRVEILAGQAVCVPALGFIATAIPAVPETPPQVNFTWQPQAGHPGLRFRTASQPGVWQREPADLLVTPHYEAAWGPAGGIRLLVDRATGKHLWTPPRTSGTLAALVDGRDCVSLLKTRQVHISPEKAVLVEEGEIGSIPYHMQWTFYAHTRRIDWHAEVDIHGQRIGRPRDPNGPSSPENSPDNQSEVVTAWNDHEHKLRLRLYPYQGPFTTGMRDLPFHTAETEDRYLQGLYWTAASDGEVGLALFNRGLMGSVREPDGALSSILAFSLPYVWRTCILDGTYSYDLGILPFLGDWQAAGLQRQALEYNFPLVVSALESEGAILGERWSPYAGTVQGEALLSALYTKAGKMYWRFYENAGKKANISIEWLGKPIDFTLTDLRENPQGSVGQLLSLRPWQVQTVVFPFPFTCVGG
jgi:hypothetical protein